MAYEERPIARQRVRRNSANADYPLTYQLVLPADGKVTPASATISTYGDHAADTVINDAVAMTVSGTLLTYAIDTTTVATWPNGQYRADLLITYSGTVYARHLRFDVVPYILDVNIGVDQLRALDDNVAGMRHGGDTDFKSLVAVCNQILQAKIETRVIEDERLLKDMLIDHTQLATAQLFFILSRIYLNRRDFDMHSQYLEDYESLLESAIGSARVDDTLSGTEPEDIGGVDDTRFEL